MNHVESSQPETVLLAFEAAWQNGAVPRLDDFLAGSRTAEQRRVLLEELVKIDLERRWRRAGQEPTTATQPVDTFLPPRPLLEDYAARYPELGTPAQLSRELIGEELWVRHCWGDRPDLEEYTHRFARPTAEMGDLQSYLTERWRAVLMVPLGGGAAVAATLAGGRSQGPLALPSVRGYEVLGELGRGGMGVVYKARHLGLNRLVALKMIRSAALATAAERARFQAEAEAIARLQHPHVVQVYEVGEHEGLPYFSLEFCEGGTLDQKLAGAPQPVRAAAEMLATLAEAVQAAHERGIVHRDLKPANVLLTAEGQLKLTDFGLAKLLDTQGQTQTGQIMGTPEYMAPEQAQGKRKEVGPAADIYALGVILYEMLTGRPPFCGESVMDVLALVNSQEPVSPSRLLPKLPRDVETICLKCLTKEPQRRYQTARALADDLRRFLENRPILARPVGRFGRFVRWCRRNPAVASLIATVFVSLVAGVVVAAAFAVEADLRAREATELARAERAASTLAQEREAEALAAQKKATEEELKARKAEGDMKQKADELELQSYRFGVALAHQEWQQNGIRGALELLNACPGHLRGWEWHHVHRLCRLDLLALNSPRDTRGLAWSPGGQHLAVAGDTGEIRLHDASTGKLVRSVTLPVNTAVEASLTQRTHTLAYSPDGSLLAWAGWTSSIHLLDGKTLEEVARLTDPKDVWARPASLAFSADGRWLALSGGQEGIVQSYRVKVWDVPRRQLAQVFQGAKHSLTVVTFDPKGRWLAAGGADRQVWLWELAGGKPVRTLAAHEGEVRGLAFSPDGSRLASGGADGLVRLWDPATGDEAGKLEGHNAAVIALAFGRDGQVLASASADTTVRLWDPAAARLRFTLRGHHWYAHNLAFSPDGRRLATGGLDGLVKVWDATRDRQVLTLGRHPAGVTHASLSPNGRWIAALSGWSHSGLHEIYLYRPSGELERRINLDSKVISWMPAYTLAFSPNELVLATSAGHQQRGEVVLWDPASGECLRRLQPHNAPIAGLVFGRDGKVLYTAADDGRVKRLNVRSATETGVIRAHPKGILCLTLSPDGKLLVTAGSEGVVRVWEAAEMGSDPAARPVHEWHCPIPTWQAWHGLAFSPDGKLLAVAVLNEVRLYDPASGALAARLLHKGCSPGAVAFSPDGRRLVSAGTNSLIKVWDVARRQEMFTLRGQGEYISCVGFSPDGHRILAGSMDGTVKVWDATP